MFHQRMLIRYIRYLQVQYNKHLLFSRVSTLHPGMVVVPLLVVSLVQLDLSLSLPVKLPSGLMVDTFSRPKSNLTPIGS